MDQTRKEYCENLLNHIKTEPPLRYVEPFLEPVDTVTYNTYLNKIKHPMDFGTVAKKLNNNEYNDIKDCVFDILRTLYNSLEFNKAFKDKKIAGEHEKENCYYYAKQLIGYVEKYMKETGKEDVYEECTRLLKPVRKSKSSLNKEVENLLLDAEGKASMQISFPGIEQCQRILSIIKSETDPKKIQKWEMRKQMNFKMVETYLSNGKISSLKTFVDAMHESFSNLIRPYFDKDSKGKLTFFHEPEPKPKMFSSLDRFHQELLSSFPKEVLRDIYEPKLEDPERKRLFREIIDDVLSIDDISWFAEPVQTYGFLERYSDYVAEPMDLSKIQYTLFTDQYPNIESMARDYFLMCDNCIVYNEKGPGASMAMVESSYKIKIGFYMSVKHRLGIELPGLPETEQRLQEVKLINQQALAQRSIQNSPRPSVSSSSSHVLAKSTKLEPVASNKISFPNPLSRSSSSTQALEDKSKPLSSSVNSATVSSSTDSKIIIKKDLINGLNKEQANKKPEVPTVKSEPIEQPQQTKPPAQLEPIPMPPTRTPAIKQEPIPAPISSANGTNVENGQRTKEKSQKKIATEIKKAKKESQSTPESKPKVVHKVAPQDVTPIIQESNEKGSGEPDNPMKIKVRVSSTSSLLNAKKSSDGESKEMLSTSATVTASSPTTKIPVPVSSLPKSSHHEPTGSTSQNSSASSATGISSASNSSSASSLPSPAPQKKSRNDILESVKMDEPAKANCIKLWEKLKEVKDSHDFFSPVPWESNPGLANYPQIIKQPMDFGTIRKKLDSGSYPTIRHFYKDCRLVIKNCETYSPDPTSRIRVVCANVKRVLERGIKEIEQIYQRRSSTSSNTSSSSSANTSSANSQAPKMNPNESKNKASKNGDAVTHKTSSSSSSTSTEYKQNSAGGGLDPSLSNKCLDITKKLIEEDKNGFFNEPVDWLNLGLEDYPEKIKTPMDLGTIKKKLEDKAYSKLEEYLSDARLVFANATTFNDTEFDSFPIITACRNLSKSFEMQVLKEGLYPSECDKLYVDSWKATCKSILDQFMQSQIIKKYFSKPMESKSSTDMEIENDNNKEKETQKKPPKEKALKKIAKNVDGYKTPFLFAEDVRKTFTNILSKYPDVADNNILRTWALYYLDLFDKTFARLVKGEHPIEIFDFRRDEKPAKIKPTTELPAKVTDPVAPDATGAAASATSAATKTETTSSAPAAPAPPRTTPSLSNPPPIPIITVKPVEPVAFPPPPADLNTMEQDMDKIVSALLKSSSIEEVFKEPVLQTQTSPEFRASYLSIIEKPMDLRTIRNNLYARRYRNNLIGFANDMELMFSNAENFNTGDDPGSERIRNIAAYAREYFLDEYTELKGADPIEREARRAKRYQLIRNEPVEKSLPIKKLTSQKSKNFNGYFMVPVSPILVPDYLSIVEHPRDLGTIKRRVENNEYTNYGEFEKDVMLVVDNCLKYNRDIPGNEDIRKCAILLKEAFEKAWAYFTIGAAESIRKRRALGEAAPKPIIKKPRASREDPKFNTLVSSDIIKSLDDGPDHKMTVSDDEDAEHNFEEESVFGDDDDDNGKKGNKHAQNKARQQQKNPKLVDPKLVSQAKKLTSKVGKSKQSDYDNSLKTLISQAQKRARNFRDQLPRYSDSLNHNILPIRNGLLENAKSRANKNEEAKQIDQIYLGDNEKEKFDHDDTMEIEEQESYGSVMLKQLEFLKKNSQKGFFAHYLDSDHISKGGRGLSNSAGLPLITPASEPNKMIDLQRPIELSVPVTDPSFIDIPSGENQLGRPNSNAPQPTRKPGGKGSLSLIQLYKKEVGDAGAITVQVWLSEKPLIRKSNGSELCLYTLIVGKSTFQENEDYKNGVSFQNANGAKTVEIKQKQDMKPATRKEVDLSITQSKQFSFFEENEIKDFIRTFSSTVQLPSQDGMSLDQSIDDSLEVSLTNIEWQPQIESFYPPCMLISKPKYQLRGLRPFSALYVISVKDSLQFSVEGTMI